MDLDNKIDYLINKLNKKKFFEVIKEGIELINKFPNLFIFYNIVGLAHQNIKNLEESEKYFLKAIEIDPKEVSPKNNLANTYLSLRKLNESENLFKEIIDQHGIVPVALATFWIFEAKKDYLFESILYPFSPIKDSPLNFNNILLYFILFSCIIKF